MLGRSFGRLRTRRHRPLHLEPLELRATPATLTVNSFLDEIDHSPGNAALTLREALEVVNAQDTGQLSAEESAQLNLAQPLGMADTIVFDPALVDQTITLGGTRLEIRRSVAIQGPATGALTLSGAEASQILFITGTGTTASLSRLTFTQGWAEGVGEDQVSGGAIYSELAQLTVRDCVFTANYAQDYGGAIYTIDSVALVESSTFTLNIAEEWGGGISTDFAQLTVRTSTFTENDGGSYGGGIAMYHADSFVLEDSLLSYD